MIEKRRVPQGDAAGRLWQATSEGSSSHTYFTHPVWLPDSSGLIFTSDRGGRRDCYLLDWPSGRITEVTQGGCGNPVVSREGSTILYASGRRIVEKAIWGSEETTISSLPDGIRGSGMVGETCDGKNIVVCCTEGRTSCMVKMPRKGGPTTIFLRDQRHLSHLIPSPGYPGLLSVAWTLWGGGESSQRLWLVDLDDPVMKPLYAQPEGELVTHEAWSGNGKTIAFTAGPFVRRPNTFALKSVDPLTESTRTLATGGNFWHCCPNRDCTLVVADTNWPDIGIQLVDVEAGATTTLCSSRARTAHPHPCLSPDGTKMVFSSDSTGVSQVYVAELP